MSNPEKTSNEVFKNMKIGVGEQGGFLIKTFVENDGASVEQTIVIDSKQADFIRDFITLHMPEADSEPALPEEPEEEGLYATQNGLLLTKDDDGDWSYHKSPYMKNELFEDKYGSTEYSDDWAQFVNTIGMDAFPLKRITERDVIALAQSKSESEE